MRIAVLDSLRGLAAGSVILYHAVAFIPSTTYLVAYLDRNVHAVPTLENFILAFSPLSPFLMGQEWIVFFFVLSGFVLALPFYGKRPPSYLNFVVRRFCRLMFPAAAVAILAVAMLLALGASYPPGYSYFFNNHWQEPVSFWLVIRHIFLMPDTTQFGFGVPFSLNTPLWTLVIEWRVGILFPLMVLCARRGTWALILFSAAALAMSAFEQRLIGTDHLKAIRWLPCFALGLGLAKYRQPVIERIQAMTPRMRALLWLGCIFLIYSRSIMPPIETQTRHMLLNAVGVTGLIALVLASPRLTNFLEMPPLLWLGKIAFSLYLCHLPIMLAMPRLLPVTIPPLQQMLIAGAISIPVAAVLFRLVEEPSIDAGRWLAQAADRLATRMGWIRVATPLDDTVPAIPQA